jgi:hypothetical protein
MIHWILKEGSSDLDALAVWDGFDRPAPLEIRPSSELVLGLEATGQAVQQALDSWTVADLDHGGRMEIRRWSWLIVLLVLLPASLYAFLLAGFEADVLAALASLLAPLVYLGYSVKAWSAPRRGEQGA